MKASHWYLYCQIFWKLYACGCVNYNPYDFTFLSLFIIKLGFCSSGGSYRLKYSLDISICILAVDISIVCFSLIEKATDFFLFFIWNPSLSFLLASEHPNRFYHPTATCFGWVSLTSREAWKLLSRQKSFMETRSWNLGCSLNFPFPR